MKKRNIIILISILTIVVVLTTITFWTSNKNLRLEIQKDISTANFCEEDTDCMVVNFGCPFGCGSFVNKNADIGQIKQKITKFNSKNIPCEYRCIGPKDPRCINNHCTIPVCEIDKTFDNPPTECRCPSGSDIRNVLDEINNSWDYACKQEICEKGNKYESAWNFYDGTWWDECICPSGTTRSSNNYIPVQQRYFFECN